MPPPPRPDPGPSGRPAPRRVPDPRPQPLRVGLLGTGSADGWPNPWCSCASCRAARDDGADRGPTGVVVDGRLLVDPGPAALRVAAREGHDLSGVAAVLLTRALPDRTAGFLLARRAAGCTAPLTVAGPPAALAGLRDAVGPDDPVTVAPLAPDGRLAVEGYVAEVLAAVPAGAGSGGSGASGAGAGGAGPVGYAVTAPSGARLLLLPPGAGASAAGLAPLDGTPVDVALLPCSGGAGADPLDAFAVLLAALRRGGAVTAGTRVVAVHLDHACPPPAELRRRLALLDAEAPPDGSVVATGPAGAHGRRPLRVLVLGGARSGKSAEAERRLAAEPAVTYVATGPTPTDDDADWAARVALHRQRRPASWRTVETTGLAALLAEPPDDAPLLVDDLGLWLTAAMDWAGSWEGAPSAAGRLAAAVDALVAAWRATPGHVVAVGNEVGSGVHPETAAGRLFRDQMGRLNARLAAESDEVWYVVAGLPQRLR